MSKPAPKHAVLLTLPLVLAVLVIAMTCNSNSDESENAPNVSSQTTPTVQISENENTSPTETITAEQARLDHEAKLEKLLNLPTPEDPDEVLATLAAGRIDTDLALGHTSFKLGDLDQAFEYFKSSAEGGNAEAEYWTAMILLFHFEDFDSGLEFLSSSVDQGYAKAQDQMAVLKFSGIYVEPDVEGAMDLFRKAADQNLPASQWALGIRYRLGDVVEQDFGIAREYFGKAAEQGEANAHDSLGWMDFYGEGLAIDYISARTHFEVAAKAGIPDSQNGLGVIYYNGYGVLKDSQEAVNWYTKAANQGNKYAQYNLGLLYADPPGDFRPDFEKSRHWFEQAAAQGMENAEEMIELVNEAEFKSNLDPDVLVLGAIVETADEWFEEIYKVPESGPFAPPTPAPTKVPTFPDVSLKSISSGSKPPSFAEPIDILLELENLGDGAATDVTVVFSETTGEFPDVTRIVDRIEPGETYSLAIEAFTEDNLYNLGTKPISFHATVDAPRDTDESNNSATYDHPEHLYADIVITNVEHQPFTEKDKFLNPPETLYVITVENIGPGGAFGIEPINGNWPMALRITAEGKSEFRLWPGESDDPERSIEPGEEIKFLYETFGDTETEITFEIDFADQTVFSSEWGQFFESEESNNSFTLVGPY